MTECIHMSTYEFIVRRRETEQKKIDKKHQPINQQSSQTSQQMTIVAHLTKCVRSSLCSIKRWFACGWLRRRQQESDLNASKQESETKSNVNNSSAHSQSNTDGKFRLENMAVIQTPPPACPVSSLADKRPSNPVPPAFRPSSSSRVFMSSSHRPLNSQLSSQSECSDETFTKRLVPLSNQRSLDLIDRTARAAADAQNGQLLMPEILGQVYLGSPRKRFLEELRLLSQLSNRSSQGNVFSQDENLSVSFNSIKHRHNLPKFPAANSNLNSTNALLYPATATNLTNNQSPLPRRLQPLSFSTVSPISSHPPLRRGSPFPPVDVSGNIIPPI